MVTLIWIDFTSSVCPDSNLLKPCICFKDEIRCGGNEDIDLVKIFQTLEKQLPITGKHFTSFILNNKAVTELKENTFSDITFDYIKIEECSKLKSIDQNAFSKTDLVTKQITIWYNPSLSSPSIFTTLSKFINITMIHLLNNNITEIPSKAFENHQDKLKEFSITGLKKIGNNAFSQLRNLGSLGIEYSLIDSIPENEFEFYEESKEMLTLSLYGNPLLNSSGFSEHSLTKFKRPCTIQLGNISNSKFTYFDERVFLPFLRSNSKNTIQLIDGSVDCSDCRNFWLKKNPNLLNQLIDLKCSNGKLLNDPGTFQDCKSD